MKKIAAVAMTMALANPAFAEEAGSQELYSQFAASLDITIELGSRCKKELFSHSEARKECQLFGKILQIYLPKLEDWNRLTDDQKGQLYKDNDVVPGSLEKKKNPQDRAVHYMD